MQQPNTAATGYTAAAATFSSSRNASKPKPLAAHNLDLGQLIQMSSSSSKQQQQQRKRGDKQQQDRKQRLTAEQVKLILAAAAEQGLRVKNGASELKRKPHGKLSRLKRLIIRERADRQLAAAGHSLQQATAEADVLQQQLGALQQRYEAAQQLQQLLADTTTSSSGGGSGGGGADEGAAPAASATVGSSGGSGSAAEGTPFCDPKTAARISVAALELAVQRASAVLTQAQKVLEKRQGEQQAAQAAWNKAYKVPEEVPEQQQQLTAADAAAQPPQQQSDTAVAAGNGDAASGSSVDAVPAAAAAAAAAAPELPSWLGQLGSESDSESEMLPESEAHSIASDDSSEEEDDSSSDGEGEG
jgi:hypothetical protein